MLGTHRLSDALGLEASGVDISRPLSESAFRDLESAFHQGQILVLRGQKLGPAEFAAFARHFGAAEPHVIDQFHHPADANILILSNVRKDGKPTGLADGGTYFHSDYSYLEVPARCTLLYSIVVPKAGGDTLFANQQAAYDDLPEAMKRRIDGLTVIHHYGNRDELDERSRTAASPLTPGQKAKMPVVHHRLARAHPRTGRKALYAVSGSSFGIVGMPDEEAIALLDALKAHATQAKYVYGLKYGVGDVVIWDNANLLHSATLIDPDDPRTLWRITVKERAEQRGIRVA
jgi:taurine dioxygenase